MMSKKYVGIVMLVLAVAMVLTSCQTGAQQVGSTLNMNAATEPPTLDPALATDTTSGQMDYLLFMALTKLDNATMEPKPWLATEWSVSDDGLVWTFKMRNDIRWVRWDPAAKKIEQKRVVNAHDVAYGVKRTIDPATASDYAYILYGIKNAQAVNTGENPDLDSVGVRAVDDYTVEFTLEQPAGYFASIVSMSQCVPMPKEAIEAHGDQWTEPGNIWSNGPYVLDTWEHESKLVMKKNPLWFDAKNVSIGTVNFAMVTEDSTAFNMYENGELDIQPAPIADLDRIKADPVLSKELMVAPVLCTYYYGFNTTKPPFDNVKVRQAFSYALDRQKLIDTVLKGGQMPATSFACPGNFGTPANDPNFPAIRFDAAKAKALLAEAGYPNGEGLPEVTMMFNTNEGHQQIAEFFQQQMAENLGVNIKLANQEWAVYLKTVDEDAPQIYRMGWCADYTDENNWVTENFHPTKSPNNPKWSGPAADAFAALCDEAQVSNDQEKRKQLYFEAEKSLCVDNAVIIPIYFYSRNTMTKPYVTRTFAQKDGLEEIWTWSVADH